MNNTKQMIIRLTPEQHRAVKVAAATAGVSVQAAVVAALVNAGLMGRE